MTQQEAPEDWMRLTGRYAVFDGMTWPNPDTAVAWTLKYGVPSREDLLFAASIIDAYQTLVTMPVKRRRGIIARLREAMRLSAAAPSGRGA